MIKKYSLNQKLCITDENGFLGNVLETNLFYMEDDTREKEILAVLETAARNYAETVISLLRLGQETSSGICLQKTWKEPQVLDAMQLYPTQKQGEPL